MLKLFEQCPACGGAIVITECKCPKCQLQFRGEFEASSFSYLSSEQLTFVKAFLQVRGNLSELEKVLGISYPTIRNKLDSVNLILNKEISSPESGAAQESSATAGEDAAIAEFRKEILKQVAAGKITAAEGLQKIRELAGG